MTDAFSSAPDTIIQDEAAVFTEDKWQALRSVMDHMGALAASSPDWFSKMHLAVPPDQMRTIEETILSPVDAAVARINREGVQVQLTLAENHTASFITQVGIDHSDEPRLNRKQRRARMKKETLRDRRKQS